MHLSPMPSSDAFARLVDKLLADPQYGERWGRYWLDVARYADTKGYVFQEERRYPYSYAYRDYVIRSFNEDKPYDRFLIEQIAADLLPLRDDKRPLGGDGLPHARSAVSQSCSRTSWMIGWMWSAGGRWA